MIFINYMEAHAPRVPSMEDRQAVADEAVVQRTLKVDRHPVSTPSGSSTCTSTARRTSTRCARHTTPPFEARPDHGRVDQDLEDRGLLVTP